jgi:cellulose synthase (UDP-forming)
MRLAMARFAIVLATIFTVRYFYWRALHSYNPAAKIFFWTFLIAEMFSFVESALFYFITWNPTHYRAAPVITGRSVDVFIPTYNEPVELLRETVVCAVHMRYPHKTYILDDGRRDEVRELAREFGCGYLVRENRMHAKAGNLNNALAQTDGEFIVTLDADHVAQPDLIEQMIGFFGDPKVSAVQATQDFYNLDSFQHLINFKKRAGWQQQELFFSVIQPGKDRYNAAFYCGSPGMLRRTALEDIGGFQTDSITEDMHTSLRMQKHGWRVLYYNKTVARGLAPQTFVGFATQWQRWGHGAMQVLRAENPLFGPGLNLAQRLCYFASFYFYWLSYQKLFFVLTPAISLLFATFPLVADPLVYAKYFVPYFFLNVGSSIVLQGGFKNFLLGEQFNIVKMHVLMKTLAGLLKKESKFSVTPKSRAAAAKATEILLPLTIVVILGAALMAGWVRLNTVPRWGFVFWALIVNLFWALVFFIMMGLVVLRSMKRKEMRSTYRFPARLDVRMRVNYVNGNGPVVREDFARNLNRFGVSITLDQPIAQGTAVGIELKLPQATVQATGKVMRNQSYKINNQIKISSGIRFDQISPAGQDEITKYLFWEVAPREGRLLRLTHTSQTEPLHG